MSINKRLLNNYYLGNSITNIDNLTKLIEINSVFLIIT